MSTAKPIPVKAPQPGIRRDGTQFDGNEYTDGLWCRFYRGRPKKMGGYQAVATIPEAARGMNSYAQGGIYLHIGGESHLTQVVTNFNGGLTSGPNDRTPAAFAANINNLWQQDIMYTATGGVNNLVANAGQNLADISSAVETPIYFGPVTANTPLVATAMLSVAGGIVSVYPYLIGYSINGRVDCSAINNLAGAPLGSAFVTGQKIVKGLPLRNAGGPAFLLWSLDSLVMATFNAAITLGVPFSFNTVTDDTSILSSQGVLEYDGIYFWMGVDRFLMFNGVVREVPNQMNLSFFFDNINYSQRQKAFAFKIPRWGEIWFCAPLGNATECNHAVIYNIREGTWYDTPLPGTGRTAAIFASVYQLPFMADPGTAGVNFTLWQHEVGVDAINGTNVQPIDSYFVTDEKDFMDSGIDKCMRVDIVEPDFVQTGAMKVTVIGRANARSSDVESQSNLYPDLSGAPLPASQQVVGFKEARRLLRFKFESNVAGGNYYMGKTLAHVEPDNGRFTQ